MSDPDDFEYWLEERTGTARALVYGILLAWAVLIIGGCSWVLWRVL
jgi:hypothetical protein